MRVYFLRGPLAARFFGKAPTHLKNGKGNLKNCTAHFKKSKTLGKIARLRAALNMPRIYFIYVVVKESKKALVQENKKAS